MSSPGQDTRELDAYKVYFPDGGDVSEVVGRLENRLFTLRNISDAPAGIQKFLARETLDLFVPIAHKYGLYGYKSLLEDLCLSYLEPEAFRQLNSRLHSNRDQMVSVLETMMSMVRRVLARRGIRFRMTGRIKSVYSIFEKMKRLGWSLEKINDVFAIRVITGNVTDCYAVLEAVRDNWETLPDKFRDYIVSPKPNGYQSIHLKLKLNGYRLEVQVRSEEMHRIAESGDASHFSYKEILDPSLDSDTGPPDSRIIGGVPHSRRGASLLIHSPRILITDSNRAPVKLPRERSVILPQRKSQRARTSVIAITKRLLRAGSAGTIFKK